MRSRRAAARLMREKADCIAHYRLLCSKTDWNETTGFLSFTDLFHASRSLCPGHGEKGIYDYNNFNSKDTFKCVLDAFDYLKKNYEDIDVLGYSMGGALATYLSSVRKFNKLILLAPANHYFNPIAFVNGGTYAMSKFRALEKSIVKKDEAEQEAYKEVLKNFKVDQIKCASYTFRKYLKTYIWHAYKEFKDIG